MCFYEGEKKVRDWNKEEFDQKGILIKIPFVKGLDFEISFLFENDDFCEKISSVIYIYIYGCLYNFYFKENEIDISVVIILSSWIYIFLFMYVPFGFSSLLN